MARFTDPARYPKPTKASQQRAQAHREMQRALVELEAEHWGKPATFLNVISSERKRQARLVAEYNWRYGPNA